MSGRGVYQQDIVRLSNPITKNISNENATIRSLVHLLETLIINVIVKNRYIPEDEIREEVSIVLRGCEINDIN